MFLPDCDAEQIKEMFGPVSRYMIETEDGSAILVARPAGGRVEMTEVALKD